MRKISAGLFMSLDGVVEAPETWNSPYFDEELYELMGSQLASTDMLLFGRRTYQQFASFWPTQTGPIADQMNGKPKLVASSTLETAEWAGSSIVSGGVCETLSTLKQQPGGTISIVGSVTLVRSLLAARVLDELGLLLFPVVVGKGAHLFDDFTTPTELALVSSRAMRNGVLSVSYALPEGRS